MLGRGFSSIESEDRRDPAGLDWLLALFHIQACGIEGCSGRVVVLVPYSTVA